MASASVCSEAVTAFLGEGNHASWWPLDGVLQHSVAFQAEAYDDGLYDTLGIQLPPDFGQAVRSRRAEFLAGRHCAAQALTRIGAVTHVAVGHHRMPLWPADIVGAISHTRDLAIALVARTLEVAGLGVDIEAIVKEEEVEYLRQHILVGNDEQVMRESGLPFPLAATLVFSAKESLFKALYPSVGQYFGFDAAQITGINLQDRRIELSLTGALDGDRWTRGMRLQARYCLSSRGLVATALVIPRPNSPFESSAPAMSEKGAN